MNAQSFATIVLGGIITSPIEGFTNEPKFHISLKVSSKNNDFIVDAWGYMPKNIKLNKGNFAVVEGELSVVVKKNENGVERTFVNIQNAIIRACFPLMQDKTSEPEKEIQDKEAEYEEKTPAPAPQRREPSYQEKNFKTENPKPEGIYNQQNQQRNFNNPPINKPRYFRPE